jgi:hypothetical protein
MGSYFPTNCGMVPTPHIYKRSPESNDVIKENIHSRGHLKTLLI